MSLEQHSSAPQTGTQPPDPAEMFDPRLGPGAIPDSGDQCDDWQPIVPVPDDAPAPELRHSTLGGPSLHWRYTDADGRTLCYICRFETAKADGAAEKTIRVRAYGVLKGRTGWHWKSLNTPRPLYNLHQIAARADAWVIVCEGEKAADAASFLFPDCIATTPMHGAQSPHKADWSVLAGRDVFLSADSDEPGRDFADRVCELLRGVGARIVGELKFPSHYVISDRELVSRDGHVPVGWDLANALEEGWTPAIVESQREAQGEFFVMPYQTRSDIAATRQAFESLGGSVAGDRRGGSNQRKNPSQDSFKHDAKGVYFRIDNDDGSPEWAWFCSPLEIVALTRDSSSQAWGRLLKITDPDGHTHSWAMPMSMLAGEGTEYRTQLHALGLRLAPGKAAKERLHLYLTVSNPRQRARNVPRTGWHNGAYVFPDTTYGAPPDEDLLLQSVTAQNSAFHQSGTLSEWQQSIGRLCVGNSRLAFSVSIAFAAAAIGLLGEEGGGFNLRGSSSIGKSTALRVAGSVWGGGGVNGYVRNWRTTDNALEAVALSHCDALLCLDELGQVDGQTASECAYMLANGTGKSRASRDGSGRLPSEWRTIFLSTGELSLAEKMAESNRTVKAGQDVRVCDIPADPGAGLGLFETRHEFASASDLARHLSEMSKRIYGTPIRSFISCIVQDPNGFREAVDGHRRRFMANYAASAASEQVRRVAARFAIVAAAGECAIQAGILPWPAGQAQWAVGQCFAAWLQSRGGDENAELLRGIEQVQRFIESHSASRFTTLSDTGVPEDDSKTHYRAGFRRKNADGDWEYLILPEVWRKELCKGYDIKVLNRALVERGILISPDGKSPSSTVRIAGYGKPRVYRLSATILAGESRDSSP